MLKKIMLALAIVTMQSDMSASYKTRKPHSHSASDSSIAGMVPVGDELLSPQSTRTQPSPSSVRIPSLLSSVSSSSSSSSSSLTSSISTASRGVMQSPVPNPHQTHLTLRPNNQTEAWSTAAHSQDGLDGDSDDFHKSEIPAAYLEDTESSLLAPVNTTSGQMRSANRSQRPGIRDMGIDDDVIYHGGRSPTRIHLTRSAPSNKKEVTIIASASIKEPIRDLARMEVVAETEMDVQESSNILFKHIQKNADTTTSYYLRYQLSPTYTKDVQLIEVPHAVHAKKTIKLLLSLVGCAVAGGAGGWGMKKLQYKELSGALVGAAVILAVVAIKNYHDANLYGQILTENQLRELNIIRLKPSDVYIVKSSVNGLIRIAINADNYVALQPYTQDNSIKPNPGSVDDSRPAGTSNDGDETDNEKE